MGLRNTVAWLGLLCAVLAASACAPKSRRLHAVSGNSGSQTLLVLGENQAETETIRQQARELGAKVSGTTVLRIEGSEDLLAQLQVPTSSQASSILDVELFHSPAPSSGEAVTDVQQLYSVRESMGLDVALAQNPTYDGRGVILGIPDDGFSPIDSGLQTTSTGLRKIKARSSASDALLFQLQSGAAEIASCVQRSPFFLRAGATAAWCGEIDETTEIVGQRNKIPSPWDLNGDGQQTRIQLAVFGPSADPTVCVDVDLDGVQDNGECFRTFEISGEFGFWDQARRKTILASFESTSGRLRLSEGETPNQRHGEGVSTVVAGYRIAGQIDGIAPGAQILDFDQEETSLPNHRKQSLSSWVEALEWFGSQGAHIVIATHVHAFNSPSDQAIIKTMFDRILARHNMIMTFSATNDAPNLMTALHRNQLPARSLAIGAYLSQRLAENVYGTLGVPPEGRLVFYSSRGPSTDFWSGADVLGPIASLAVAPDGVYPFSGTSNASPCVGGLAANLLSAVLQSGQRYSADALLQAIRYSAQRVTSDPFVFQGFGLPNFQRAFSLYPRLLAGELPTAVTVEGTNFRAMGNTVARGIFEVDPMVPHEEYQFQVRADLSAASSIERTAFYRPIRIEYSADWIQGPRRLFLSNRFIGFSTHVDFQRARNLNAGTSALYEEIRLVDDQTGIVLQVMPVTVLLPNGSGAQTWQKEVALQSFEGKNEIINTGAANLARVTLSPDMLRAPYFVDWMSFAGSAGDYAQHRFPFTPVSGGGGFDEILPISIPGTVQLGLSRSRGSQPPLNVRATVKSAKVQLINQRVISDAVVAELQADQSLDRVFVQLHQAPEVLGTLRAVAGGASVSLEVPAANAGIYTLEFVNSGGVSQVGRSFDYKVTNAARSILAYDFVPSYAYGPVTFAQDLPGRAVTFVYTPFDTGFNSAARSISLRVVYLPLNSLRGSFGPVDLAAGTTTVRVPLAAGARLQSYDVKLATRADSVRGVSVTP